MVRTSKIVLLSLLKYANKLNFISLAKALKNFKTLYQGYKPTGDFTAFLANHWQYFVGRIL
jgi:hypothetical protein